MRRKKKMLNTFKYEVTENVLRDRVLIKHAVFFEFHYCLRPNEVRRKSSTNADFPGRVIRNRSRALIETRNARLEIVCGHVNPDGGQYNRARDGRPASGRTRPPL